MRLILALFLVGGLNSACSSGPNPAGAAAGRPATPPTAAPAPAAAPTTYQQLQGKWQSTDDARSVIELKDHLYIDYYGGKRLATATFVLDQACPGTTGAGHPSDNGPYLVEPKEGMCWEIIDVTDTGLSLSYTARGNTLNYRRLK